jgi:hypothetical protein
MTSLSKAFPKVALLLLPLALSACAGPGGGLGGLIPARPAAGAPATPAPGAAPPPPAPPSLAELAADPQRFKGMSGGEVSQLLGRPSYQRHEADAEIWQYYGPGSACVLDLFVYPDQGVARVAHAELRSRAGGGGACLAQILSGTRG